MYFHFSIFDLAVKKVKVNPRPSILVVLGYPMLHTKFHSHWSIGSGKDDFKGVTIYGHGDHLGNATQLICINFISIYS